MTFTIYYYFVVLVIVFSISVVIQGNYDEDPLNHKISMIICSFYYINTIKLN